MMPGHDLVVIGGSAGALEALQVIVRGLPQDLPASILVVIHASSESKGYLVDILKRQSRIPVRLATDGEELQLGEIYIARPDHHLLVKRGLVRVVKGPRENGFRPAIDPLFRTAARAHGNRVVGVLLSGGLDDGTHGLMRIKRGGGVAIVQRPEEALVRSMPESAIHNVDVDHIVPAADISAILVDLAHSPVEGVMDPDSEDIPDVAEGLSDVLRAEHLNTDPSRFTCPECGGALWERREGKMLRYLCHVGHGYTSEALLSEHTERAERALWSAVRVLEENAAMNRRMAEEMRERGLKISEKRFESQAEEREQHASVLRQILTNGAGAEDSETAETIAEELRPEYEKKPR